MNSGLRLKRVFSSFVAVLFAANMVSTAIPVMAESNDVQISLKPQYNADIVLTVEDSSVNPTNFQSDLTAKLKELGVKESRIKVTGLKAQEVNTQDNFAWDVYDHKGNWGETNYPNGDGQSDSRNNQHIIIKNNGKNMVFYGYGQPAYKDFMFMANDSTLKKTFQFELNESGINYHSMEGGGFLFNSKIEGGKLSGYCILFTQAGISVYKINGIDVNTFHNYNGYTQMSSYPGITLVKNYNKANSALHKIKIETDSKTLSMWDNGSQTINALSLDTQYGNGFGPIASYLQHSCSILSYFAFNNLSMQTTSVAKFKDLIRKPEWNAAAKKFVVNLNDTSDEDFHDASAYAEIQTRIGSEGIHYIGWGTNNNKSEAEDLITKNNGNGIFVDNSQYTTSIDSIAQYIYEQLTQTSSGETKVIIGQPMDIDVTPANLKENTANDEYPLGGWKLDHDDTYYENSMGKATFDGQYMDSLNMIFDKPGKYGITFRDNVVSPNTVYAHRLPVANFDAEVSNNEGNYSVSIKDYSFDEDRLGQSDKGIKNEKWQWRDLEAATWTEGQITETLQPNKQYIIQLKVQDYDGAWSVPAIKYVSTKVDNTEKPLASFILNPETLYVPIVKAIKVVDNSYDPQGQTITERLWSVSKDGKEVYSGAEPLSDFSGYSEGKYTITLKVKTTIWSESFSRSFTLKNVEKEANAALGDVNIGYAQGDSEASVTKDLILPAAGTNNSLVRWSSDNASVTKYGKVTRPGFLQGDKTVHLTATLYNNGANTTKNFTVIVKALPNTVPVIANGEKLGYINKTVIFTSSDFTSNYTDAEGSAESSILITALPVNGKLMIENREVNVNEIIQIADINKLSFVPDNNFVGKTKFEYKASDGFAYSSQADFIMNILDDESPIISNISITSNNKKNPVYAKTGDTITVLFSASEELAQNPKITILGNEASVTKTEGNMYKAQYVVKASDSQGAAKFEISEIKDVYNNEAQSVGATTDESYVVVDTVAPKVSGVEENGSYKPGIEAYSNEGSLLLNGKAFISGDKITSEGVYVLKAEDSAGNITEVNFSIDGTAPIISKVKDKTTYKTSVKPEYNEGTATLDGKSYESGTEISDDGTHTLIVTDKAGNTTVVTFTIDKSLPKTLNLKGKVYSAKGPEANAKVTLEDINGKVVENTVTDKNGNYLFKNEKIGLYRVIADKDGLKQTIEVNLQPVKPTDEEKEVDVYLSSYRVIITADPNSIVGDGEDKTTLTVTVVDENNNPVPGKTVTISVTSGTLVDGNTVITDKDGNALFELQAPNVTGDDMTTATVTAKVNGLDVPVTNNAIIHFAPGAIKGVVVDNETGLPVEGAVVEVSKDFDNNGIPEFYARYVTGKDGKYKIAIPKGNVDYNVNITKAVKIGGKTKEITFRQKTKAGSVTPQGKESYNAVNTAAGLLLMKNPDGGVNLLQDYSNYNVVVVDENGDNVSVTSENSDLSNGVFNFGGLEKNKTYYADVYYTLPNGGKIKVGASKIAVSNDGEINITNCLIDPYGDITDKETGKLIAGADVKLYYADTQRNKAKGINAGTLVELPEVKDFPPADNLNPQLSDANGKYAWMVFPDTDYYIVATADGYEKYVSPVISVDKEIVRHDIAMTPIKSPSLPLPQTGRMIDNFALMAIGALFIAGGLFIVIRKRNSYEG